MFTLETLLMKLMELGFTINYEPFDDENYRLMLTYRNINAGVTVPKGEFKEGIYKAMMKMSDAMIVKAGFNGPGG